MGEPRGPLPRGRLLIAVGIFPALVHIAVIGMGPARMASALGFRRAVDVGLVLASGVPHSLAYLGLLAMFGATLRPGREALITTLARRMYGAIPDDMAVYTRRATWVWCGFFAAQLATSLLLFVAAPLVDWSFFVNVLNLPLVALMFVAEQACRPFLLRDAPRHTPGEILRMIGGITSGLWKTRSG
jgi:uncharacterized membrane protein